MKTAIAAVIVAASLTGCSSGQEGYKSATELANDVCDKGTVGASRDGYDYPCFVDGQKVLITDWSTFGGVPQTQPNVLTVDDVFGIAGPPAALDVIKKRLK